MPLDRFLRNMERRYVSIKEAAAIVGVTPLTLRNWDKKGVLTSYRNPVNNYRVYRLDQIELFLRKIENSKNKRGGRRIDISMAWIFFRQKTSRRTPGSFLLPSSSISRIRFARLLAWDDHLSGPVIADRDRAVHRLRDPLAPDRSFSSCAVANAWCELLPHSFHPCLLELVTSY